MARPSSPAPTRMVFLLHGEDPFRIRLRTGELVAALLAGEGTAAGDLTARSVLPYGTALGLTRVDARDAGAADTISTAGQSPGLFAAPDERRVVLVEHAEALSDTAVIERFPADAAPVLVAPGPIRASRSRSPAGRPRRHFHNAGGHLASAGRRFFVP